eukprot:gene6331-biopygen23862
MGKITYFGYRKSGGGVGKTGEPKVRQIRTNSPGVDEDTLARPVLQVVGDVIAAREVVVRVLEQPCTALRTVPGQPGNNRGGVGVPPTAKRLSEQRGVALPRGRCGPACGVCGTLPHLPLKMEPLRRTSVPNTGDMHDPASKLQNLETAVPTQVTQ